MHPLVRPTKSGLLNMLYGVLEISISLRQPVYFFKFTSGLKKIQKYNLFSKPDFSEHTDTCSFLRCTDAWFFFLNAHTDKQRHLAFYHLSTHNTLITYQRCNRGFIAFVNRPFFSFFLGKGVLSHLVFKCSKLWQRWEKQHGKS